MTRVLAVPLTAILAALALAAGPATAAIAARPGAASPVGAWHWPLAGVVHVLRGFSAPATPYAAGHRGVDLAAAQGSAVLAAGAGTVGYAGLVAGIGVVTVLHAGGLRTTYEPVAPTVRAGARVSAGELLGRLSGRHGGCPQSCLHWGLRRGAVYLDPLSLLGSGQVRLLPPAGRADPPPGPGTVTGPAASAAARAAPAPVAAAAPPAASPPAGGPDHRPLALGAGLALTLGAAASGGIYRAGAGHIRRTGDHVAVPPGSAGGGGG